MHRVLAAAALASLSACGGPSLKENPEPIVTLSGAPEGFAFDDKGALWVVRREAQDSLKVERLSPPSYDSALAYSFGPAPEVDVAGLAASGGHIKLEVVAGGGRLALLYSQVDAPQRQKAAARALFFRAPEAGGALALDAAVALDVRAVALGAAPDLSEIFVATSRGISTYGPDGRALSTLSRGLDNDLGPNLFGAVSFDAKGARAAHWLPTHDPSLSPPAVQVIDLATGDNVGAAKAADDPRPAFSPDGTLLAYRVENDIDVWDIEAQKRVSILQGAARDGVRALTFLPGGRELLVDQADRFATFYDVDPVGLSWRRGAVLAQIPSKDLVGFTISPLGDVVAARSGDGQALSLFRLR
jgi:hypothetical protein